MFEGGSFYLTVYVLHTTRDWLKVSHTFDTLDDVLKFWLAESLYASIFGWRQPRIEVLQ